MTAAPSSPEPREPATWQLEGTGLGTLLATHDPHAQPIVGPLVSCGPAEIVSARRSTDSIWIPSVVVRNLNGTTLWSWGSPESGQGSGLVSDRPCQISDWDGDGQGAILITIGPKPWPIHG